MHILTFDIEDWFHTFDKAYYNRPALWETLSTSLEENVNRISGFLDKMGLKATFFWLGWEAHRYPQLVKKLLEQGHEIAAHSYFHTKISDLSPKTFYKDTERVVKTLEDITGKKVKSYRAPGMSINSSTLWALDILSELGIEEDSSLVTGQLLNGKIIPDRPLVVDFKGSIVREFPVSSFPIFGKAFNYSSSGYFRITPFWYIQKKILNKPYTMSYFHPRDFDVGVHKFIKGNPYLKLKYRLGAKSTFHKLEQLTGNTNWISVEEADRQVNWDEVETLVL